MNHVMSRQGSYHITTSGGETVKAFIPPLLPPSPPIRLEAFQPLLDRANQALGRMDGLSFPTAKRSLDYLKSMGILSPFEDKKGKTYVYRRYFDILSLDTEPL